MKRRLKAAKIVWKWRKLSRRDYPLHYMGPSTGFIEQGLPIRPVAGYKAAPGAGRFISPDGVERIIHRKDVRTR